MAQAHIRSSVSDQRTRFTRIRGFLVPRELIRYVISGGFAFVCDYSVLYLATDVFGIHYLTSNLLGYGTGLAIVYTLNVTWVFEHRVYQRRSVEMMLFGLIAGAGAAISEGVMYALVEGTPLDYLVAKIFASIAVVLFNFVARKHFLFRKPDAIRELGRVHYDCTGDR